MLFGDAIHLMMVQYSEEGQKAIADLHHAQQNFNYAEHAYVDKAIYELNAAERGLVNVMQEARKRCVGDGFRIEPGEPEIKLEDIGT